MIDRTPRRWLRDSNLSMALEAVGRPRSDVLEGDHEPETMAAHVCCVRFAAIEDYLLSL